MPHPDEEANSYFLEQLQADASAEPEHRHHLAELELELERAIDALPQAQKQVFIQHEVEGISFKEMAAASGIPVNTLLARKRYAVRSLQKHLEHIIH